MSSPGRSPMPSALMARDLIDEAEAAAERDASDEVAPNVGSAD